MAGQDTRIFEGDRKSPVVGAAIAAVLGVGGAVFWALSDDRWSEIPLVIGLLSPVLLVLVPVLLLSARRNAALQVEVGPDGIFDPRTMTRRIAWDEIGPIREERVYAQRSEYWRLHLPVAEPDAVATGPDAIGERHEDGSGTVLMQLGLLKASRQEVIAEIRRYRDVTPAAEG